MEEFKEPRRGRPRKKIKIIDSSIRIKGGGYDWGKVVDGVKDYSSKKDLWASIRRMDIDVPNANVYPRVAAKRTYTAKRNAAIVEIFREETEASKLPSSAKNKYVQKQRLARKGIAKGETTAIQSGFKIQITKASRSALASLGIKGTSDLVTNKIPLTTAFRQAIRKYITVYLSPNLVKYMKERQLKSKGSGRFYAEVEKDGVIYRNHRASAVGLPAANLSGQLARSYRANYFKNSLAMDQLKLTNVAPYADELHEHGRLSYHIEYGSTLQELKTPFIKHTILSLATDTLYAQYQNIVPSTNSNAFKDIVSTSKLNRNYRKR